MLFNDSGFVRFRMGDEASEPHIEMVSQPPPQATTAPVAPSSTHFHEKTNNDSSEQHQDRIKKKLRASQSFDEAVLGQDNVDGNNPVAYHATSDPEAKDNEDDVEPELEAIYEPPPSSNR